VVVTTFTLFTVDELKTIVARALETTGRIGAIMTLVQITLIDVYRHTILTAPFYTRLHVGWFTVVVTALVTPTTSTSSPISTGIGDHLWRICHPGIYQCHSAWPFFCG